MGTPKHTSENGIELIKSFEGFRARAARLPTGTWLIGYGHTRSARAGLQVSRQDADLVLRHADLPPVERFISDVVLTPLSQNEFDALVSFAWNIGETAFAGSDVLAELNSGDRLAAASAMLLWRRGRVDGQLKVIDGLVRRRVAEMALFLEHPSGRSPVPSALIRPQREHSSALPTQESGIVVASRDDFARTANRPRQNEGNPRDAAQAVRARIDRILAESGRPAVTAEAADLPPVAGDNGPTVEEITSAIEALAGQPADLPPAKGPPEGVERRRVARQADLPPSAAEHVLPLADDIVVDDLARPAIDPASIERAVRENGRPHRGRGRVLDWIPFALLAGLGLVGIIAGIQSFLAQAVRIAQSEMDVMAGPLLLFGGAILLVTSSYYLYRALTRAE